MEFIHYYQLYKSIISNARPRDGWPPGSNSTVVTQSYGRVQLSLTSLQQVGSLMRSQSGFSSARMSRETWRRSTNAALCQLHGPEVRSDLILWPYLLARRARQGEGLATSRLTQVIAFYKLRNFSLDQVAEI